MEVTGIILAGGKSKRMGHDKATLEYKSRALCDWALDALLPFCNRILISSNNPLHSRFGTLVPDRFANCGPMAGIASCLEVSETDINLVIACDTPFVNTNVYAKILEHARLHPLVMAAREDGFCEPLIGSYHKSILPLLLKHLQNESCSLNQFGKAYNANFLTFTNNELSVNMNTPNDLYDKHS